MHQHAEAQKVKYDVHMNCFAQELRSKFYGRIGLLLSFCQTALGASIFADAGKSGVLGAIVALIGVAMTTFKFSDMAAESKAVKTSLYKLCMACGKISDEELANRYYDVIVESPSPSADIRGIAQVCCEMSYEGIDHTIPAPDINLTLWQWVIVKLTGFSYILSEPNVHSPWSRAKN